MFGRKSHTDPATLARQGLIDTTSPVQAQAEILIHANIETVWFRLSNINRWPEWNPAVKKAHLQGKLEPGTAFAWKANGMQITSVIQHTVDGKKLTWTGKVAGINAVHDWELMRAGENETRVITRESMSGFLAGLLMSRKKLEDMLNSWLAELKKVSETG